ncbi:MAG: sigma-70 family RNA polymerase sigma factor [Gammaproteobacteria bacterium]|nr:sigma-70 family RNA polymerase sigma factor [Gammaproteobacteria bacterium]MBU2435624.1 sigma-70 family RNA polymerase sigma factor [Gammaproteobacteria bacterium]MBU2449595.1 sigma-70 family RNA polymerase sigma factor [Gammaproteobacteria bacterium]
MNAGVNLLIDDVYLAEIRRDMIKFAHLQLRDEAQAEDVVQEALVAALDNTREFAGRSAVKTWIFAILKNKIVDLIRLQVRTTNVSALSTEEESLDQAFESLFKTNAHWSPGSRPSNWGDPEESLREQRFWEVFDACLKHLPANTARVFMMREFLEFETAEVCQELSLTTSNCNVILHRARNGLRRCLESNWFSAGEQPC